MINALRTLDWHIVQIFVNFGHTHHWFHTVAAFCAQILIVVFIPVLYILWRKQQPASEHMSNKKAVMLALVCLVFAVAVKTLIALVYFRMRPFVTHPEFLIVASSHLDPQSFPSGHTLVAASITFSLWLSGMKKLGWWLLVVTLLVALGRVAIGVHYPTDVIGALIISVLTAWGLHHESSSIKRYLPNS